LNLKYSLRRAYMDGKSADELDPSGAFLAAAAYDIHNTYHTTLKLTPAKSRFRRDMSYHLISRLSG
jgi:hypothetical protein